MHGDLTLKQMQKRWHGSLKSYAIGFAISLVLTSLSFLLVIFNVLAPQTLIITITALALVQAVCQLLFFLHLGGEGKLRWETVLFLLMVTVLLVIALGSLWVMHDLNVRTMHMEHHD